VSTNCLDEQDVAGKLRNRLERQMSPDSIKPTIFISYAHLDEPDPPEQPRWLSFVMEFLRPGVKGRKYEVWMDRLMPGGADWNPEIEAKIRTCDIFVLLVSTRSTGSDYIVDNEIPIVRERQRNNDGVYFYPLLLDWTPKAGLEQVNDKNLRPRDAKPLSSLSASERSRAMAEAADEIAEMEKTIEARKTTAAAQKIYSQRIYRVLSAAGQLVIVDLRIAISGLPETFYERLVGRDAELNRLDEAWRDNSINILSLIAEGGAGKSALVNEWLTRMQVDGYRGAERVLGWSFYSQGSKEPASAADEFLDWTLAQLDVKLETTSASSKGEAIAEALTKQSVLLLLDGVEPLQHGPGPQVGQVKDPGLRALLRRFAAASQTNDHTLIVLTSRVAVADLQRFRGGAAPVVDVEQLSDEAGAELLRDNDIWGIDKELRQASNDFGGHPLALTLLASLLKETQNGDVRRRDHIRGLLADADNPRRDRARRVMESYEREWLADQPALLAVLHCVGLFDRPATADCLQALRSQPKIPGLTDVLVDLTDEQWRRTIARLREVRLIAPIDPCDPEALDAHPLVREWFGERARLTNEAAWKAAHSRLYDHLRDTTHEGERPTLTDLAPLYHAIAHGCRAGRHREALEVYIDRICRRFPDGKTEFYSTHKLGAMSSNLAAISWFFERPYETPVAALKNSHRAWVLNTASLGLRAHGRLGEALPATRASLRLYEEAQAWSHAAMTASNLSEGELLIGEIDTAVVTAEKAVTLANRGGDARGEFINRTTHADALHAAGEWEKAGGLFADAERGQQEWRPEEPWLYSLQGYRYCDLLLSQGHPADARDRAAQALEIAIRHNWAHEIGLDALTLGRAYFALALPSVESRPSTESTSANARAAGAKLDEAVEDLRASGRNYHVARGLLARAAFRRAVGDWNSAKRDLNEAKEIAEPALMRLYWCDCALESARLALARREAFAPLVGLVERSPPPVPPDPDAAAALKEEARKELDVARKLIAECGYHRRDEELAELDEVVAGGRRFAGLPPRV
jgi:hypothetical protein